MLRTGRRADQACDRDSRQAGPHSITGAASATKDTAPVAPAASFDKHGKSSGSRVGRGSPSFGDCRRQFNVSRSGEHVRFERLV
jgi:hypothetical protein